MVKYELLRDLEAYLRARVRASIDRNVKDIARRFGYLDYMIARYLNMLGSIDEVLDLLNSFEKPLNPVIRCNKLKVRDCSYMVSRLKALDYDMRSIMWEESSYIITKLGKVSLGATHEFLLGLYYLYRGPASLVPPLILNPKSKDMVLDMAAAPGGKTSHMAQLMNNEGVIIAVEVNRIRVRALRSNLERLGVKNTIILRMNAINIPKLFGEYFTKVLLDAPCSGEGLIQIDKSRKTKTTLNDLLEFRKAQIALLNAAINTAISGGYILYTTCSIAPEENELVIAEAITRRDDVEVVKMPKIDELNFSEGLTEYYGVELPNEVRLCGRLYPNKHGMEGFFLCLLRKL
ncbi:MAG: RNA methyltransferase [Desulfurococcales archaeon ex4484_42]|nr:MAG: RNA methyltransferase [Desulfurococcales archaeon ex4484_42]